MNLKKFLLTLVIAASLLFTTDGCSKTKAPAEKIPEPTVVRAVVAGQFYPGDKDTLRAIVEKYLKDAAPAPVKEHVFGIAVPHAGYQYSGPVAAYAFKAIEGIKYSTVVIMAPSHQVGFEGIALTTKDFYETPLGKIPIAKDLSEKLISKFAWAKDDPRPYNVEHSLEVELPFLQMTLKIPESPVRGSTSSPRTDDSDAPTVRPEPVEGRNEPRLLPIIIGICNSEMLGQLAGALGEMLPGDDVLFVASTDLSHYHPYNEAVGKDTKTIKLIETMDVPAFAAAEKKGEAELCGSSPVESLMEIAKLRGGKAKLIKYANSGDTAGDKSRVVGYAAIAFVGGTSDPSTSLRAGKRPFDSPTVHPELVEGERSAAQGERTTQEGGFSDAQKRTLLSIARAAIESEVKGGRQPVFDIKDPLFLKDGAAFVTIRKHGDLRGCIGHIIAMEPLWKSIRDNAIAAASQDPRFPPVSQKELGEIDLEISVLTEPKPLANPLDVRVGQDGLIIQKGFHRGVLLPQVPTELGWSKERFLEGICEKAGLPPDSWKDANLLRFQAIVFHE